MLKIFATFGTPEIDLSASHQVHHLPTCMSLDRLDQNAYAVDMLSQWWDHVFLHAFPSQTPAPTVLNKLRDILVRMILVALCWSNAPWLLTVLELTYDLPRCVPLETDLQTNVSTGHLVKNLESLQ